MTSTFTLETSAEDFSIAIADPKTAIMFALDYLEPFEVSDFLSQWRECVDLSPWLAGWKTGQRATEHDWSGHPVDSNGN